MQDETGEEELAATLDASVELLPWLPELFGDVEDLGVRARDVLKLLTLTDLPDGARVLDLGCGKGSALIALAQRYQVTGLGVDGVEAFLEHATRRAHSLGLEDRLAFDRRDVRSLVSEAPDHDLVMLLALGPVFGDASETIARLRGWVAPGGLMLLDEAYLPDDLDAEDVHWEFGLSVDELVRELTQHGDELVAELVYDTPEYRDWCGEVAAQIQSRARLLAERAPELARELTEFAERQSEETQSAESPFVGALFLLRRSAD